jgi:hypothetical protein
MIKPAKAVGADELWEASTRSVRVEGGLLIWTLPLQATRTKLATTSPANKRADFFKRNAPKLLEKRRFKCEIADYNRAVMINFFSDPVMFDDVN